MTFDCVFAFLGYSLAKAMLKHDVEIDPRRAPIEPPTKKVFDRF